MPDQEQMREMVKDPGCKNKNWKADVLEPIIDAKIREVLHSPELVADIAASRPQPAPAVQSVKIENVCIFYQYISEVDVSKVGLIFEDIPDAGPRVIAAVLPPQQRKVSLLLLLFPHKADAGNGQRSRL